MPEKKELNKEELTKVAGGGRTVYNTLMVCINTNCEHSAVWAGDYIKKTFNCPKCGQYTFKGKEEFEL